MNRDDRRKHRDEFLKRCTILPHDQYLKAIESGEGPVICVPGISFEFPDNMHGKCMLCQCVIHFRPYNQTAALKICVRCAVRWLEANKGPAS